MPFKRWNLNQFLVQSEPVDGSVTMDETITELNKLQAAEREAFDRLERGDNTGFESPF